MESTDGPLVSVSGICRPSVAAIGAACLSTVALMGWPATGLIADLLC